MDAEDYKLLRKAAEQGLLKNLSYMGFSLTGRLSMKRDDMIRLIRACNGRYDERPSYGTNFLIVGDTSIHGRTAKMREAEARGTRIISESQFVEMIAP